ncbi:type I-C CRISPR-associated protein Cas8c/Csd1 [Ornithinibacillus sp. 4-3]|uniref:Type I-C CRISPR-associated protein Cas8c/Csd1 n=1 Tax=Ornithinibacillus sp. 4-3 TaxID=3231488 RepID=A0AB39HRD8_9BACI
MSWMQRLVDIYDKNSHMVGVFEQQGTRKITLMPISHIAQNAQIEMILDRNGNFHRAEVIPKEEAATIVPATLDSANRAGSKIAPHYVHDKLFYVAKDYQKYGTNEKRYKNFDAYEAQMKEWLEASGVPTSVKIITSYIQKGTLIQDLINEGIIFTDDSGNVIETWSNSDSEKHGIDKPDIYKVTTGTVFDAFVRFDVLKESPDEKNFWENKEAFDAYIHYLEQLMDMDTEKYLKGICDVTGEEGVITTQHGSKLRHAGDQSKIISSNDSSGYTYRGRFKEPTEVVQIGYKASQKAHQALRWLNQKQAIHVDTRYFLTFGTKTIDVPQVHDGTLDYFKREFMNIDQNPVEVADTEEIFAKQVNRAILGMKHNFENSDKGKEDIIHLALDAATSGRLAIVYYQEQEPDIFLGNLKFWHDTCSWRLMYRDPDTKRFGRYIGTPSTFAIAKAVYGERANPAVKKEFYTRILPCITEKRPVPKDVIRSIYQRVIRPESFKDTMESWEQTLNIACALIKKNYQKEVPSMALQKDSKDIDYLFGRLLGVAEVMERTVLNDYYKEESRPTNATRYFNVFANRPGRTWDIIRKQLNPYIQRLQRSKKTHFIKQIQEIEDTIGMEIARNKKLSPVFLAGYSSQVQELYKKNKEEKKNDITK